MLQRRLTLTPAPLDPSTEEIIALIAKKHQIILDPKDPAMALLTALEHVSRTTVRQVREEISTLEDSLADTAVAQTRKAEEIAKALLERSIRRQVAELDAILATAAPRISADIASGLNPLIARAQEIRDDIVKTYNFTCIVCGGFGALTVFLAVFIYFGVMA